MDQNLSNDAFKSVIRGLDRFLSILKVAWILAFFRRFWDFLYHFFIILSAFTPQKLFFNQRLYVYKKLLQQNKTDGEKGSQ